MIVGIHSEGSEMISTIKEVLAGKDIKASFSITEKMTVEIQHPYWNINFRTWFCPQGEEEKRPGWGITLSLKEFEIMWKWAGVWSQFMLRWVNCEDVCICIYNDALISGKV